MAKYRFEQIAINCKEKKKPTEEDRFTYIGLEHLDTGSLNVTRFGSDVAPIGEKLIMRKGDVLFGKRRAYQKKVAVAPFDGIFSAHGMVLRPKEDVVDKNFFPLFISSDYFLDAAIKISVGSLSPTINWRDLKDLEFEMPDLHTQKKLAEVLWAINNAIESYKKLISATDELVKSQFIEMFGDPIENPMCWDKMPLSKSCEIVTGNTPPRANKEYYGNSVEWIKSDNIQEGLVFPSTAAESLSDEGAAVGRLVDTDCLLMTCIAGGLNSIGNLAVTNRRVAFNQQINAIIPKKVNVWFMYYLLTLMRPVLHDSTNRALKCILTKGSLQKIEGIVPNMYLQEQFAAFVRQSDKSKFAVLSCLKHRLPLRFQDLETIRYLIDPSGRREFSQQLSQENYNG